MNTDSSILSVMLLGFFLGVRHATDADHVIAVATIVSQQRSIAGGALIGILWGIGHTVTIVAVGVAVIAFHVAVPPRISLSLELAVAAMLVVLGVLSVSGAGRTTVRRAGEPLPCRSRAPDPGGPGGGRLGWYRTLRPIVVGVVHGLAGSAAIALLVLTAVPDPVLAGSYLAIFGLGTIVGMMLITGLMAWPIRHVTRWSSLVHQRLAAATGVLSVVFGLFLTYQIGITDGLFARYLR